VVKNSRLITYILVAICCLKSVSIVSQFEDTLVIQPKLDTSYLKKEEKNLKFFFGFDARR
jgi:hypothetical protein